MKNCPGCETELQQVALEADLPAYACPACQGVWLVFNEYLAWQKGHPLQPVPDMLAQPPEIHISHASEARICPDCGYMLRRYKVWPQVNMMLDRCSHCQGVWLDAQEWQALHTLGLVDHVNLLFTGPWQHRVRSAEVRRRMEKMYLQRFGEADYAEIQHIRAWLAEKPNRASLLAFLIDEDPFHG